MPPFADEQDDGSGFGTPLLAKVVQLFVVIITRMDRERELPSFLVEHLLLGVVHEVCIGSNGAQGGVRVPLINIVVSSPRPLTDGGR